MDYTSQTSVEIYGKQMVWLAIPWLLLTLKRFVTGNK